VTGDRRGTGKRPETARRLHELRVREIELEMQNEELREANRRLEEATRRYRELYDLAPVAYFALDSRGTILEANLAGAEVLGQPRARLLGQSLFLLLPREERDVLHRHLRGALRGGGTHACLLRLRPPGQGERFLRVQSLGHARGGGRAICRSAAVDITAAKRVQEELAAANDLNHSIVQSVEESLVVLDRRLRVISANASFCRVFRADPASVAGASLWRPVRTRWHDPELQACLERMSRGGPPFTGLEIRVALPGLGLRELEATAQKLGPDPAGTQRFLLSIRDLTERKEAQRRLQSAIRRLEEANRQLSQFASVVSHDLKSPLRVIRSYAEFLSQDVAADLPAKQQQYLDGIGAAARLAEEQVTGLLTLAGIRRSSVAPKRTRLGPLVRRLAGTIGTAAEVRIESDDAWPTVVTEPVLLRQVLGNLLDNAIKYNPSTRRRVWLRCERLPGREVEIFVRDNGPGIPEQHRAKIFEPFRRLHAHATVGGSGLGLSIARTAVDRLGGSIHLDSEMGKGSTFCVRLPMDGPEPVDGPGQASAGAR